MNFIALGVIAEIDNIYAGSLSNDPIKKTLESREPLVIRKNEGYRDGIFMASLKTAY
jgi:hypothetical protein